MRKGYLLFAFIYIALFYVWIHTFRDYESMLVLGTNLFPIGGAVISSIWLHRTFLKVQGKLRYFWMLLNMGNPLFIVAHCIWFYYQHSYEIVPYPNKADIFWVLQYSFVLSALLFKLTLARGASLIRSIFDIIIFMAIVTTLSIHFLIIPIMATNEYSLFSLAVLTAYPIFDLGFLFVMISLFYTLRYKQRKIVLSLITLGLLLQVVADSVHVYLMSIYLYAPGSIIDPLWVAPLLLNGIAGMHAKQFNGHDEQLDHVVISSDRQGFHWLPYAGVITVLLYMLAELFRRSTALEVGIFVVMLLITIRQIYVMLDNRRLLRALEHMAYYDTLTDLPNKMTFQKHLVEQIEHSRHTHSQLAVMYVDLDRFKFINDTMGHSFGDLFLKHVSQRLNHLVHHDGNGTVYRHGGDEFCIIIPNTNSDKTGMLAARIIEGLSKPIIIHNEPYFTTPSIGISMYPNTGEDKEALIRLADIAMYAAKKQGGNHYRFYTAAEDVENSQKLNIENGLRKAIDNQEFILYYQPKNNLNTGEIIGLEALIRWQHPDRGCVSPLDFISIAEETGLIVSLGRWVLQEACRQMRKWHDAGFVHLGVAVNISPRQFQDKDFLPMVAHILRDSGLDPQFLELEITESIMQNIKESSYILAELKILGVQISIDDFGTGYSSLSYLKHLSIDNLKIDKSFVDEITVNPKDEGIIKTIIDMGHHLKINVTAEGIENEEQLQSLRKHNCHFGQGYFFSKPLPPEEIETLLNIVEV